MAGIGTLAAIARQRPAFMSTVVQAFESLHGKATNFWDLKKNNIAKIINQNS